MVIDEEGLKSIDNPDFKNLVSDILSRQYEDAEERLKVKTEEERREHREAQIKKIPGLYLSEPDPSYATQAWDRGRQIARRTLFDLPVHGVRDWLFISGKTGRGKSHLAGMVASMLSAEMRVAWINCEELDYYSKLSAGGDDDATRYYRQILSEPRDATVIVLDDLGKPDTKSDGVSLPHRIQPIHHILERARTGARRKMIIATSEYNQHQLGHRLSEGVVSRLFESTEVIEIKEPKRYKEWLEARGDKR